MAYSPWLQSMAHSLWLAAYGPQSMAYDIMQEIAWSLATTERLTLHLERDFTPSSE